MIISIEQVKKLRNQTGISLSVCREALEAANGDYDGALRYIEASSLKNLADFEAGFESREVPHGRLVSYVHNNNRVAALLEVNCETDFAANTNEFKEFCENLVLHIVGANSLYLSDDDIPESVYEKKAAEFRSVVTSDWDSDDAVDYLDQEFTKWSKEVCLLDQGFIMNPSKTINELRAELSHRLGEKVIINRFVRWEVGKK